MPKKIFLEVIKRNQDNTGNTSQIVYRNTCHHLKNYQDKGITLINHLIQIEKF